MAQVARAVVGSVQSRDPFLRGAVIHGAVGEDSRDSQSRSHGGISCQIRVRQPADALIRIVNDRGQGHRSRSECGNKLRGAAWVSLSENSSATEQQETGNPTA